ncbi:hypothetical protein ACN20G_29945 (plasmid) [Streptomyces sp. BI20]|uniref:hypothetical protein n=1 Tax=Streptomyces sp. BI20 TaxID=3403460 RepID=UPI003C7583B0
MIEEPKTPKVKRSKLITVGGPAVVVVLAGAGFGTWYALSDDGDKPTSKQAISHCEDYVRDKLKAPASAQFSPEDETGVYPHTLGPDEWKYEINGYVDSQNGFGAMIRGNYRCLISTDGTGGDSWDVKSLNMKKR